MTIRWTYTCDGPGCDLRQEMEAGLGATAVQDITITMKVPHATTLIWAGHLCDGCRKGMESRLRMAALSRGVGP